MALQLIQVQALKVMYSAMFFPVKTRQSPTLTDAVTGSSKGEHTQRTAPAQSNMEAVSVRDLVERLGSDLDAIRKKAAFGLQSHIGDPSFADVFIAEGGLVNLRHLALKANGNTLAYSLTSLSKLLEVDKGWDHVNQELVERVSGRTLRGRIGGRGRNPDLSTDTEEIH